MRRRQRKFVRKQRTNVKVKEVYVPKVEPIVTPAGIPVELPARRVEVGVEVGGGNEYVR